MACLESEFSSESSPMWLWDAAEQTLTEVRAGIIPDLSINGEHNQGLLLSPMKTADDMDEFCYFG